jgi:hypothetical protein
MRQPQARESRMATNKHPTKYCCKDLEVACLQVLLSAPLVYTYSHEHKFPSTVFGNIFSSLLHCTTAEKVISCMRQNKNVAKFHYVFFIENFSENFACLQPFHHFHRSYMTCVTLALCILIFGWQ